MASLVDRHGMQRDMPDHVLDPSDMDSARETIIRALFQSGWSATQVAKLFGKNKWWVLRRVWGGQYADSMSTKGRDR